MPSIEQLKHQLLELGILTLITVLIWIGYGVYSALTNSSQSQVTKEELLPLPQNINTEQIEKINERMIIEEITLQEWREKNATGENNQENRQASGSADYLPEAEAITGKGETGEATLSGEEN